MVSSIPFNLHLRVNTLPEFPETPIMTTLLLYSLISLDDSQPFIIGISQSIRINLISGVVVRKRSSASYPLEASIISISNGRVPSMFLFTIMFIMLSSTIIIFPDAFSLSVINIVSIGQSKTLVIYTTCILSSGFGVITILVISVVENCCFSSSISDKLLENFGVLELISTSYWSLSCSESFGVRNYNLALFQVL